MVHSLFMLAVLSLAGSTSPLQAAIVSSGDISPTNPAGWTSSTESYIGNTSNGVLTVNASSVLYCGNSHVGFTNGASGEVTIDGSGSTCYGNNLYIGESGNGTLNITGGGVVNNGFSYVGYNAGSTGFVSVDGAGSKWTHNYSFDIGVSGNGTLSITNGGNVSNLSCGVGYYSGSTGVVTVDGAGSKWTNNYDLDIGKSGNGTLNISNGGTVWVGGVLCVARDAGSQGSIHFGTGGGTLTAISLMASPNQLSGAGTITTNGLVSDVDLVFDSTHGMAQSLTIGDATVALTQNLGNLGAGFLGNGSLTIRDGMKISSKQGYVGFKSGSTGTVAIDGTGSKWTTSSNLSVGESGSGTLNLSNAAAVSVGGATYVARLPGAAGSINFGTGGGTLTTASLFASSGQLTGAGTINTGGLVSDVDLTFDSTHGSSQVFQFNNVKINLNQSSGAIMGAGYLGAGSMTILNGKQITSYGGYIGYKSGSNGIVSVSGTNSKWTDNSSLYVGNYGNGTLNVVGGGTVSCTSGSIGDSSGSTGAVTIDGNNSKWNASSNITVGRFGNGTLNIKNGGVLTGAANYNWNYIGFGAGSTGTVTINGAGSKWANTGTTSVTLDVGESGAGTLNVTGGGYINNHYCYLGDLAGSTGTVNVDGANSALSNVWDFYVGNSGNGSFNITQGGAVNGSASDTYIGYNAGSSGTVTVDGTGSKWSNSVGGSFNRFIVGYSGSGKLNIAHGGFVSCGFTDCAIGYSAGSVGIVSVDGTRSVLRDIDNLFVGYSGNGTLNITNGGSVTSGSFQSLNNIIGFWQDSTGVVNVDGLGSKFSLGGGIDIGFMGYGILNVKNGGLVAVTYGSAHIGGSFKGVVTVDGAGSKWTQSYGLDVGFFGNGTLNISNGGLVAVSGITSVASYSGSNGSINFGPGGGTLTTYSLLAAASQLTGVGTINTNGLVTDSVLAFDSMHDLSQTVRFNDITINLTQNSSGYLGAGYLGVGSLVISDGKNVASKGGYIGYQSGSQGVVRVSGAGSTWTNTNSLIVGNNGRGILNVCEGGTVSAAGVSINNQSLLAIDIGTASKLVVSSGNSIKNNGIVRLLAGASPLSNGVFAPISATWDGTGAGAVQAVGGRWDSTSQVFTVSGVQDGVSGAPVSIDRLSTQRVLIGDIATSWILGASFASTATTSPLTLTATAISDGPLSTLNDVLGPDRILLGGWTLSAASGYTAGDPIYLSFGLGTGNGYSSDNLQVWSYTGTKWSNFLASDLASDGKYASFTTTSMGCFALTTVPEPSTLALLAFGLVGLVVAARRKRRRYV